MPTIYAFPAQVPEDGVINPKVFHFESESTSRAPLMLETKEGDYHYWQGYPAMKEPWGITHKAHTPYVDNELFDCPANEVPVEYRTYILLMLGKD